MARRHVTESLSSHGMGTTYGVGSLPASAIVVCLRPPVPRDREEARVVAGAEGVRESRREEGLREGEGGSEGMRGGGRVRRD